MISCGTTLTFWTILVKIINKCTKMILGHGQLQDFSIWVSNILMNNNPLYESKCGKNLCFYPHWFGFDILDILSCLNNIKKIKEINIGQVY